VLTSIIHIFLDTARGNTQGGGGHHRNVYLPSDDRRSVLRAESNSSHVGQGPGVASVYFSLDTCDGASALAGQAIAATSVDPTGIVWVVTSSALLQLTDLNGDGDAEDAGEVHTLMLPID
jgi:hypothetical protein